MAAAVTGPLDSSVQAARALLPPTAAQLIAANAADDGWTWSAGDTERGGAASSTNSSPFSSPSSSSSSSSSRYTSHSRQRPRPASSPSTHDTASPAAASSAPSSSASASSLSSASSASEAVISVDVAYREVVKRKHRLVDSRRRQRETATIERLASLAALPDSSSSSATSGQRGKRRALDKVATLEAVASRIERLMHRVDELEEERAYAASATSTSASPTAAAAGQSVQQPVLAWPVDCPFSPPAPPAAAAAARWSGALSSNASLVQGCIKALCVHAGSGRYVDGTALAKRTMTGSIDGSLEQLSSPSWIACQRMMASAAARGELAPYFYYSANQQSQVEFIGPPSDPGLTQWLSELYQLFTRRRSVVEGNKLFRLSDGQWHASTSRLWLLDRDTTTDEQQQQREQQQRLDQGGKVEVDWDTVVVILSLTSHLLPPTPEQAELADELDVEQAESELAEWRQWSTFSDARDEDAALTLPLQKRSEWQQW